MRPKRFAWAWLAGLALTGTMQVAAQVSLKPNTAQSVPPAQIAVSPSRLTLELGDRPVNGAFRLTNLSDRAMRIRVTAANFDLDQRSKVRVLPPNPQSLDQWLVLNPSSFEVAPGSEQVVRFSVRPRVRPQPGEHRAVLYFAEDRTGEVAAAGVSVSFRLGVIIYAMVSPLVSTGTLHGVSIRPGRSHVNLRFDVQGTGNAHVRLEGQYSLWSAASFPGLDGVSEYNLTKTGWNAPPGVLRAGLLPAVAVLAGSRRVLQTSFLRPERPGQYRLAVRGTLGGERIDRVIPLNLK